MGGNLTAGNQTMVLAVHESLTGTTGQAIAMIIYFVGMIMIGLWAYTRTQTMDDYMLGGRELNPLVAALSAGAADMSGWLLMGLPGALYLAGIVEGWIAVGLSIGAWINWLVVAPRLRSYTEVANDSITVPSFLSYRLRDNSNLIRIIAGVIICLFFTIYVASGMVAGGKFFATSFGWDYHLGMTLIAGIVVTYTLIGGFLAVSWTDTVQGIMMLVALILVPVVGVSAAGGIGQVMQDAEAVNPDLLNLLGGTNFVAIVSNLAWGLGYFGMPHIIVRFMALKTPGQARSARRIGMGWMILSVVGAGATAIVGISLNKQGVITVPSGDEESVFLIMGQSLFPSFLAGFMLAAILAAIMSTISSQLLVTSSAVVEDIYNSVSKRNVKEAAFTMNLAGKQRQSSLGVQLGRVVVLVVTIIGALIAWQANSPTAVIASSILGIVSFAWAGFGAAFGPIVILSLYWRKLTAQGAMVGMVVGAVTVVAWHYLFNNGEASVVDTGLYEILPGFVLCLLAAWLLSVKTYRPNAAIDAEFAEAVKLAQQH